MGVVAPSGGRIFGAAAISVYGKLVCRRSVTRLSVPGRTQTVQ